MGADREVLIVELRSRIADSRSAAGSRLGELVDTAIAG